MLDNNREIELTPISDQSINEGQSFTLPVIANDPDGNSTLQFALTTAPIGMIIDTVSGLISWQPAHEQIGPHPVVVSVTDTIGNPVTADFEITVLAIEDTTVPTNVTLNAPAFATPGQSIPVTITAEDNVGVETLQLLIEDSLINEVTQPSTPLDLIITVPNDAAIGSELGLVARAEDANNNQTDSDEAIITIVEPNTGFIVGEVYDDSSGLALNEVTVDVLQLGDRVLSLDEALEQQRQTDASGRYELLATQGEARIKLSKPGYTSSYRTVMVNDGEVATPLDGRLTPIIVQNIEPFGQNTVSVTPSVLNAETVNASLTIPVTALGNDNSVIFQLLTPQSLPSVLPIGWSPRLIFAPFSTERMTTTAGTQLTMSIELINANEIVVQWNRSLQQWERIETGTNTVNTFITLTSLEAVAIVRPDTLPAPPPMPALGEPLQASNLKTVPEDVTTELLPIPQVLFYNLDDNSTVSATLLPESPLPSGTVVRVDFAESYERIDGQFVSSTPSSQTFSLFQTEAGLTADFIVTPSLELEEGLLKEGVINLAAQRISGQVDTLLLGAAGGTLSITDALTLNFPTDAVRGFTPITATAIQRLDPGIAENSLLDSIMENMKPVAGFDLALGNQSLLLPARVQYTLETPVTVNTQFLLVQPVDYQFITEFVLVDIGSVVDAGNGQGTEVVFGETLNSLPLPGVTHSGAFYLIESQLPLAYITGEVTTAGRSVASSVVRTDQNTIVGTTNESQTNYVLASPLGNQTITGLDLTNGNRITVDTTSTNQAEIITLDLSLAAGRPTVANVIPAVNSNVADVTSAITVTFSQPMDADTINPNTFKVRENTSELNGAITVSSDGLSAVFRPADLLQDATPYEIFLDNTITDDFGKFLFGNQTDETYLATFTTLDTTPPPRPEAGQVDAQFTAVDEVTYSGTQGSAEPGSIIFATNQVTGVTTSVLANADGSFDLTVAANPGEDILLRFSDQTGNSIDVPVLLPVVVVSLEGAPDSILFVSPDDTFDLNLSALLSDGTTRILEDNELVFVTNDSTIAAVDGDGVVSPINDGSTDVMVTLNEGIFTYSADIPITVSANGVRIFDEIVGVDGIEFEAEDELEIIIPPGALSEDVIITIDKLPIFLTDNIQINLDGDDYKILSAYRFRPSITFDIPIEITFPVDPQLDNSDINLPIVFTSETDEIENLIPDTIIFENQDESDEFLHQWYSRLHRDVVVNTNRFSTKVLTDLVRDEVTEDKSDSTAAGFTQEELIDLSIGKAKVQNRIIRTGKNPSNQNDRTNSIEQIIHHATFPSVPISVDIQFGQNFQGDDTYIYRVCGNNINQSASHPALQLNTASEASGLVTRSGWASNKEGRVHELDIYNYSAGTIWIQRFNRNSVVSDTFTQNGKGQTVNLCTNPNNEIDHFEFKFVELFKPVTEQDIPKRFTNNGPLVTLEITYKNFTDRNGNLKAIDNNIIGMRYKTESAHFAITPQGEIIQFYGLNKRTNHTFGRNNNIRFNDSAVGIELFNTGHEADFYTGPQIDSLISLDDFILNRFASTILTGSKQLRRNLTFINNKYNIRKKENDVIFETEPVITHREADDVRRDTNFINPDKTDSRFGPTGCKNRNGRRCNGAGSKYRKADPNIDYENSTSISTYNDEAIAAALSYDFPGLINTSGGDVGNATPQCRQTSVQTSNFCAGKGGDVSISYGSNLNVDSFPGLLGARSQETVQHLTISQSQSFTCSDLRENKNYPVADDGYIEIGNLIINGTLDVRNQPPEMICKLRISGTFYLSPTGHIKGNADANDPIYNLNGSNFEIISAGPVILHGLIDLSGADRAEESGGWGGNLTINSLANSPLLIPTIVTQGGDVGTYGFQDGLFLLDPLVGIGGPGGAVKINGPPEGLIVFSGIKESLVIQNKDSLQNVIDCNYFETQSNKLPKNNAVGAIFPVNFIPKSGRLFTSFDDTSEDCASRTISSSHPTFGLSRSLGRGILTSGGNGGTAIRSNFTDDGAPGGEGGSITINFTNNKSGAIRFRDVTFITGGGEGFVKSRFPNGFGTTQAFKVTGSSGGQAAIANPIIQFGRAGGDGGTAGAIFIDPNADILPLPTKSFSLREIQGLNGESINETFFDPIAEMITMQGNELLNSVTQDINLLTLVIAKDTGQKICDEGFATNCLLGGAGGFGGNLNAVSGEFGANASLTMPASLWTAFRVRSERPVDLTIPFNEQAVIFPSHNESSDDIPDMEMTLP